MIVGSLVLCVNLALDDFNVAYSVDRTLRNPHFIFDPGRMMLATKCCRTEIVLTP